MNTITIILGVLILAFISYMILNRSIGEGFWNHWRRGWPGYRRYGHWRPIVRPVILPGGNSQPIIYDWTNAEGEQFYRYN